MTKATLRRRYRKYIRVASRALDALRARYDHLAAQQASEATLSQLKLFANVLVEEADPDSEDVEYPAWGPPANDSLRPRTPAKVVKRAFQEQLRRASRALSMLEEEVASFRSQRDPSGGDLSHMANLSERLDEVAGHWGR